MLITQYREFSHLYSVECLFSEIVPAQIVVYVFKKTFPFIITAGKQESLTWPSPYPSPHTTPPIPLPWSLLQLSARETSENTSCVLVLLCSNYPRKWGENVSHHSKIQALIIAWMGLFCLADTCLAPVPWLYLLASLPPPVGAALILLLLVFLQHVNPSCSLCICFSSLFVFLISFRSVFWFLIIIVITPDCPINSAFYIMASPCSSQWSFTGRYLCFVICLVYVFPQDYEPLKLGSLSHSVLCLQRLDLCLAQGSYSINIC